MCTWRAERGREGRWSSPSCVDVMREPFGLQIVMGLVVGRRFRTGALMVQKWAVQPVSAIAGVGMKGGGQGDKGGPIG
jgi:hypothetical protein